MVHNKELFLGSSDDAARAAEPNGLTARSPKSMAKTRSMIFSQQGSLRRASLASLANKRDAPSLESVMGEERVLGDLLAQMELAVMSKKTAFNYIFVNLTDSTQEDIPAVKQTITVSAPSHDNHSAVRGWLVDNAEGSGFILESTC